MKESLFPQERLRKKKDFLYLYKKGRRYRGEYFNLVYLANNLNFSRMAVVVSGKIGNAVVRNRIKRRIRDLFRRNKDLFVHPLDILVIAKKEIKESPWPELRQDYMTSIKTICRPNQNP